MNKKKPRKPFGKFDQLEKDRLYYRDLEKKRIIEDYKNAEKTLHKIQKEKKEIENDYKAGKLSKFRYKEKVQIFESRYEKFFNKGSDAEQTIILHSIWGVSDGNEIAEGKTFDAENVYFPPTTSYTLEKFLERKLKDFDCNYPKLPTGKFKDSNKIYAVYQQKFLEVLRDSTPQAIAYLRSGLSDFEFLVGKNNKDYLEKIRDIQITIFEYKLETPEEEKALGGYYRYMWGRNRRLFYFFYYAMRDECVSDDLQEFIDHQTALYRRNFYDNFVLPRIQILETRVQQCFQDSAIDKSNIVSRFLSLQNLIYQWADKFYLHKDWLFEGAFKILNEMSIDETVLDDSIPIYPTEYEREFSVDIFKFVFPGWEASEETAEEYIERAVQGFQHHLAVEMDYTANSRHSFKKRTKKTKTKGTHHKRTDKKTEIKEEAPPPPFESIKWLIAWNEGATHELIGRVFNQKQRNIKAMLESLPDEFNLPRQVGKRGQRKSTISVARVQQIKDSQNRTENY